MSRACKCFGASGLSLLLNGWALDLKMLALFYFGQATKGAVMKKCPRCGTENKNEAFRCKNENCLDILPQYESEESSNINPKIHKKRKDMGKQVNRKENSSLLLLITCLAVVVIYYIFGLNKNDYHHIEAQMRKANRAAAAAIEHQREEKEYQRIREAVTHANEYWGKRYEDWERSVGNPQSIRGRRGELGLTPVVYPSLGIVILIDDDNKIIKVYKSSATNLVH